MKISIGLVVTVVGLFAWSANAQSPSVATLEAGPPGVTVQQLGPPSSGTAVEVYRNDIDYSGTWYYISFDGYIRGDDITLKVGPDQAITEYWISVYHPDTGGTYDVTTSLHEEIPVKFGGYDTSTPIPGTQCLFDPIPADGNVWILGCQVSPATCDHGASMYVQAQSSHADAGWVIAETAESGFTDWLFARDGSLTWWFGGTPYAGLWARVEAKGPCTGACCNHDGSCDDDVAEAACPSDRDFHIGEECKDVCNAIPTVSEWGLVVMTLLGCTLGTILYGRRRVRATG